MLFAAFTFNDVYVNNGHICFTKDVCLIIHVVKYAQKKCICISIPISITFHYDFIFVQISELKKM